jgi:ABC-2 type transport system ATP-binding protein
VLFSTHVMQHAERLCDRVLLIARGRRLFDGTVAEALRTIPRRLVIESSDDVTPLRSLAGVSELVALEGDGAKPGSYELRLRENADPQAVLASCFERGIRLRRFDHSDPTLHEVFVSLVGPEAREASFR